MPSGYSGVDPGSCPFRRNRAEFSVAGSSVKENLPWIVGSIRARLTAADPHGNQGRCPGYSGDGETT